ncbi:hypothetical protein Cadr_000003268 [Camelus dromedarius]|uniref:Uncharacterized protein n=1 Tax=Camelus dromedarius TaxID=9838 RepID=A0A5N4C0L3_CAMDR|nr:hypothetical protein Cadr_000003268 [Camelus dromedarius]
MGWGRERGRRRRGDILQCLEGIRRHLRSFGLAGVHQRELSPGSYNPYGGSALYLREIHAPSWKHAGN